MGMVAILFNGADPFEQIVNILSTIGPMWTLHNIIHAKNPGARAGNHHGTQLFL